MRDGVVSNSFKAKNGRRRDGISGSSRRGDVESESRALFLRLDFFLVGALSESSSDEGTNFSG